MSKKRSSKMSRRYAAKIFGRYELDEEGKPMKDKFGDKIEVSFYKFYRAVFHRSRKPASEGKYSDMLEMKAYRLKQLQERQ